MKINTLKNAAIMLFVASLALVSCSDDSDPTPVQPTIVSAGTLPSEVGIGNSVDISFDIGPREVNIVDVTVTETIAGADGSAKGTNELGSIGGNIGLNTYTYTASNVSAGDNVTLEITVLGEGNLSASLTVNIAVPECPGDIAGTYLATTDASTPFDGPYDNTGSPCRLTIVDNGDGSYTFSDLTAGLYGDYYAGIVGAREDCEDISGLEGNVTRTGCSLAGTVPDHPGFICRFGENDMRVSAVIDVDGVITLSFENPAGDKGTATLVKQ